ncbi:MAG: PilT/PilU family type 4a pilus ATPase [Polyangiaceae bacterium]|nr:PilT/PilU family type 4a pilus ATPase [Polyangiaceae bacterium]
MSQLAQLLRFLERDDVSDVVLQTNKAPMARVGEGYHPLSKSPITTPQIEAVIAGSPVAELLPRGEGSSPVTRLMLFGKPFQVRAARRDGSVQVRFERAASPGSVGTAAARPVSDEPEPPPRVSPAPAREERLTTTAPAGELTAVLADARAKRASDVHIVGDRPVQVRLAGQLRAVGQPVPASAVQAMLRSLLTAEQEKRLEEAGYVDLGVELPGAGRIRANVSRQRSGWKGSFRLVMEPMPTLASLGLPPELAKVTTYHQGLVVIAGPNGHGKTTTLAAIVDVINSQKAHHILTAEDPVEFVHARKKALMSQREVGSHTRSFASALKASLREDPDVIVIGELRDRETVEIAITAAETGHLVIATMSTPNAAKTIDRLIDLFPPADQQQVRVTLAGALKFVVAQRLLPNVAGDDFVAAVELISGSPPLWAMIRDNKLYQLPNLVQRGRAFGMIRFDDSLAALVKERKISEETALAAADSKKELANVLRGAPAGAAAPAPAPKPAPAPTIAAGGKLGDLASKVGIGGLFGKKE